MKLNLLIICSWPYVWRVIRDENYIFILDIFSLRYQHQPVYFRRILKNHLLVYQVEDQNISLWLMGGVRMLLLHFRLLVVKIFFQNLLVQ